jgi:hypothetical protein
MNKSLLTISALFCVLVSFAAPRITVTKSGLWSTASNWNLNRLPQSGDTIDIPSGITVVLNADRTFDGSVYLIISGTLEFQYNNTVLNLTSNSTIVVANGRVKGGGSPSQKIRLGGVAIFDGDDQDISGYYIANGYTNGFTSTGNTVLPVQFVSFTADKNGNDVLVQWSTASEQNAFVYEIERSSDGNKWHKIAAIPASGYSNSIQQYAYTDKSIAAQIVYYRIKQVDNNSGFTYTAARLVKGASVTTINIAAASGKIVLQFAEQVKANLVIRIINYNGQVVNQQVISNAVGKVVLPTDLKGQFIVSINGSNLQAAGQVAL